LTKWINKKSRKRFSFLFCYYSLFVINSQRVTVTIEGRGEERGEGERKLEPILRLNCKIKKKWEKKSRDYRFSCPISSAEFILTRLREISFSISLCEALWSLFLIHRIIKDDLLYMLIVKFNNNNILDKIKVWKLLELYCKKMKAF